MTVLSFQGQRKLALTASVLIVLFSSCSKKSTAPDVATVQDSIAVAEITNANNFALAQEPIYFSFYDLGLAADDARLTQLHVVNDGKALPAQLIDQNGDGQLDGVLAVADFTPAQVQTFTLSVDKKSAADQPKQQTPKELAQQNSSQEIFGFWNGKAIDSIAQLEKHESIVTNSGDLFSALKINYNEWHVNNQVLNLSSHITKNAASHLTRVSLKASQPLPNFAIGLVKSPNVTLIQGETNITGSAWTYVATWNTQASAENNNHGSAVIFHRGDRKQQTEDEHSYVSVMNTNGGDLEYYVVSASDKNLNGIKTQAEFQAYLEQEAQRLTKTPRVRFESSLSKQAKINLQADDALAWAKRLADSELERKTLNYHFGGWDEYRKRPAKFEYDVVGMQIQALQDIDAISPDEKYKNALEKVTGSYIQVDGSIATYEPELFSIDLIKPGQMVILLAQRTQEEKYRKAADYLRGRLKLHPRTTEGAFWHRSTYPNQLWLDGVYMGIPFLVQYAAAYETGSAQHESFVEAVHEFEIARNHLRNPDTGLYFHAWDESKVADWSDKQTGRAPQYWSRGMGWYAMALVDVLDFIPASETELRKSLIDIVNEFAADILRYQDPATATWWQITDRPNDVGNYRESSASAMFSYFLLKAVNKEYLPKTYNDVALKTYRGLLDEFVTLHKDGKVSMNDQCLVAGLGFGRDGSYNYYQTESIVSNDPKGNSPFIYASLEAYKFLKATNTLAGNFK